MKRLVMALALVCVSATAQAHSAFRLQGGPLDPVVEWNKSLLMIVGTSAQPATIHPTRSFAMMHAAIYDAVNAIDRRHAAYLASVPDAARGASVDAAANTAAYEVLIALYPGMRSFLDDELRLLQKSETGGNKAEGMRIGHAVAAQVVAARSQDHSDAAPIPYTFGTNPGDYQSTPPNFPKAPQFTHWPFVVPFALESAGQFRPGPPPALTSARYADAFNEVKSNGIANSQTATPDEAQTGLFWNGPIQNYWNQIAETAAASEHLTTAESARLFALLNLSLADGVIAFYDAKYTYNLWRPVTAIRFTGDDGSPDTEPDPTWLPQSLTTAADPSYPGAHAVVSAAAAEVLASFFHRDRFNFDVTSPTSANTRSFTSFSDAAREASLSRIFAGQHFRFDQEVGERLGRDVADWLLDRVLGHIDGGRDAREPISASPAAPQGHAGQ
jgi:hypothetical protein